MPAPVAALLCLVLNVTDGDTIKAQCEGQDMPLKIRLAEIDAPERHQRFGPESAAHLTELCLGKLANIAPTTKDRYGRTVARVICAGTQTRIRCAREWPGPTLNTAKTPQSAYSKRMHSRCLRGSGGTGNPLPATPDGQTGNLWSEQEAQAHQIRSACI